MKDKVTFYLKDPQATRETLLYAFFHFHNTRVKLSTGLKIHPDTWNPRKYRQKSSALHARLVNDRLERISSVLGAIYLELMNEGRPITPDEIRTRYAAVMRPTTRPESFFDCYQAFIDSSRDRLQRASLQVHETAKTHLTNFETAYGVTITFDRIDSIFFDKLVSYLTKVAGLNNTTTWKIVKTVRAFLRWSVDQGHTRNAEYLKFTKRKLPAGEASDKAYLTVEELNRIIDLDLKGNKRLERTRDLFIFQAHTGLRYGDVFGFNPASVQGESIVLVTSKNRKAVTIPLLPAAKAILEKYNNELPKVSNQKQNTGLKDLMTAAGIISPVVVVDYKGIDRIDKVVPKAELIGTHSAKRTFVTILRQRGVSVEAIMRITGNSRRTIETYILTTEDDVAREVQQAWI